MATFIFNNDIANRITATITETPKTAREIAKGLGEDKHIINQHLYKMPNLTKTDSKVPVWSLLDVAEQVDEDEDEDEDPSCEHCGSDTNVIVHSWGCVALCGKCSDIEEEPHCPRKSRSGDAEQCEDCVAAWAWIDERVPITYKGRILGYSKPGKTGIIKFSHRSY